MVRVLIFTAGFGEGHNTAARGIREALLERDPSADVRVEDLYAVTNPRFNHLLREGYSIAINRLVPVWRAVFSVLNRPGVLESLMWTVRALREEMGRQFADFRPQVVVSTYPLYSFLTRELRARGPGAGMPFITVVTDSSQINTAWYRCHSDLFAVADEETALTLENGGVPREKLRVLGFPVSPRFTRVEPLPAEAGRPWKLLFMPSTKVEATLKQIDALLAVPDVQLTVIAGRNGRLLRELERSALADRVTAVGWTDQMHVLLATHHVFIGKAGGAISQEAIAARCPFIVSHLVPGQEEGNIELLRSRGFGVLAGDAPEVLASAVTAAFADDARQWRAWKRALLAAAGPDGAGRIADMVLDLAAARD